MLKKVTQKHLNDFNYNSRPKGRFSSKEIKEVIKRFNNGESIRKIAINMKRREFPIKTHLLNAKLITYEEAFPLNIVIESQRNQVFEEEKFSFVLSLIVKPIFITFILLLVLKDPNTFDCLAVTITIYTTPFFKVFKQYLRHSWFRYTFYILPLPIFNSLL